MAVALVGVALCHLAVVPSMHAQSTTAPASVDEIAPHGGIPTWAFDQCLGGLTYGQPFKLALSYGGGLVHESTTGGADICILGAAKVGFGAARASFGIGRSTGPLGSGVALTGGVMRTFDSAWGATPARTYVGGGINVWPLLGFGGEIGYYVRVGDSRGASDRQRRIVTWSAGFGF